MGTFFDNLILIISVLGRSSVGIPSNIWRYELHRESVSLLVPLICLCMSKSHEIKDNEKTYMIGDED